MPSIYFLSQIPHSDQTLSLLGTAYSCSLICCSVHAGQKATFKLEIHDLSYQSTNLTLACLTCLIFPFWSVQIPPSLPCCQYHSLRFHETDPILFGTSQPGTCCSWRLLHNQVGMWNSVVQTNVTYRGWFSILFLFPRSYFFCAKCVYSL